VRAGHAALAELRRSGKVAFFDLPYRKDDVRRIKEVAAQVAGRFDAVVVARHRRLGARNDCAAHGALSSLYNELSGAQRKTPRLYVEDNVDPDRLAALLDLITPKRTLFIVISKSGSTVETSRSSSSSGRSSAGR